MFFLPSSHIVERSFFRFNQKMPLEELAVSHGGMTSPAKKCHIGLKCHLHGIGCLIRDRSMAHETDRRSIDFLYVTLVIDHAVRTYSRIEVFIMAAETDLCPVFIWPTSKKFRGTRMTFSSVHLVTSQTSDLSVKKRKDGITVGGSGSKVYRMVVIAVMMAIKTYG